MIKPPLKIVLVVAYDFCEFLYLRNDIASKEAVHKLGQGVFHTDTHRYVYISHPRFLRGYRDAKVLFYGRWFHNKDSEIVREFEILAKYAEMAR